jgi:pyruvate-formate lyase-activating enzyme
LIAYFTTDYKAVESNLYRAATQGDQASISAILEVYKALGEKGLMGKKYKSREKLFKRINKQQTA